MISAKPKLLYVDDEKANLTAFRILLRDKYDVLTAENAEDAYKLLRENDIPLVVTDQRMPGMTGTELLAKVASDFPYCARMILTGYTDIDAVIEGINRSQIYYYFKKPWNESEVRLTLENALEYVMTRRKLLAIASEWQETFDAVNDVIWVLDKEQRILRSNKKTESTLGCKSEDIIAKFCYEVAHNCSIQHESCPLRKMKQTLERESIDMKIGDRDFHVSVDPILDTSGNYNGAVHILSDITDRKLMEEERKQLEENLRQSKKLEAIGSLAGGIAHDFNNLLTPIIIYSEMIGKKAGDENFVKGKADSISKAALSAKELTGQLLTFSRKQVLAIKPCDLNEVVSSFLDVLLRTIRENIEIKLHLAPEKLPVMADRGQLVQIILNLIVNAQDAIAENGIVSIETSEVFMDGEIVRLHPGMLSGRYVLLAISDNGTGMDEGTLAHIFEPFYTTKPVGHGTGLGLATVYGIIKQHEGFVDVTSSKQYGTAFSIYFPLDATQEKKQEEPKESIHSSHQGTGTILVVEDNQMIREMLLDILTDAGYLVHIAATPKDALQLVETLAEPISLLITDIVMPGMNGVELFEQLVITRPELKVMYMSGYANKINVHRGLLEEGVNFLPKPFTASVLLEHIQRLI